MFSRKMFGNVLIVDKFLCFKLETGGLIISWFLLSVFIIVEIIIGYSFVQSVLDCKNGTKPHTEDEGPLTEAVLQTDDTNGSSCYAIGSNVFLAIIALVICSLIIMCCFGIKGAKERNCKFIKPLMIWEGIFTVCCIISIVRSPIGGIVSSILNAYMFVALYSFYLELKEENVRGAQTIDLPEIQPEVNTRKGFFF